MNQVFIDGIANLSLHNGVIRIECVTVGPDGKQQPSGTLLIPQFLAAQIFQTMANGTKEVEKKLMEQVPIPPAGNA